MKNDLSCEVVRDLLGVYLGPVGQGALLLLRPEGERPERERPGQRGEGTRGPGGDEFFHQISPFL